MRFPSLLATALYVGAQLLPSPAAAGPDAARALAAGTLPAMTFPDPRPAPDVAFRAGPAEDAADTTLAAYRGRPAVVNFWATWCAPCRAEMPGLQALATREAGRLDVVTVAFGRHRQAAMEAFWADAGIDTLPLHLDAEGALARALGVRGLPHTLILDAQGRVIAEMAGEAHWDGPDMAAILDALLSE